MSRNFVFHKPYPIASASEVAPIPPHLVRDPKKIFQARPAAIQALENLHAAAKKDGIEIIVISSYRREEEQIALFKDGERRHGKGRAILWLAPAGYSEHHTGYVFDLADRAHPETDDEPSFESTKAFPWLVKNAGTFGFELSFPQNNWQGIGYEPWHWRFAGDDESRRLFHPNPLTRTINVAQAVLNGILQRLG